MMRTDPALTARLYVVRHAEAGVRSDSADDHLRSLTPGGRARASTLAGLLGDRVRGEIVSSPFTRCVETVEPLAARCGRTVALSDLLAEGAEIAAMLHLLCSLPDESVVCTHGDMLIQLAAELEDPRDRSGTAIQFDKGVVWVLSRERLSLSLVDEIGPWTGPDRRDERIPHVCAAVSAHSRPHVRRSMSHG
jgi:phosphohistidine phosphatase SixA